MSPRRYDARRRQAASAQTRARILQATRTLVGGRGSLAEFSLDAVAAKAGVARMTVYNQFHSRAGLLEALADDLAARGGMARMREVFMEPEFPRALTKLVETFVRFWSTDRVTMRRLRALAIVFPPGEDRARRRDAWRREAVETLLRRFHRLPGGGEAVDVISGLTSFEMFDALCTTRRRPEQVADLLARLALQVAGAST